MRDREPKLLAGIVAVGAALRFSTLTLQSFWLDEAVTAQLIRHGFGGMLNAIPGSESTPPLYYVLLWPWSRVFGEWEAGLRSLSALLGTALIVVAYAIGRELVSRRAGLVAGALVAFNPLLVWYSQEARAYMLLALLCALSFLLFARVLRGGGRRALAGWALVSALALATHYFAVFVIVPEAIWLLMRSRDRRAALAAVALPALAGAALLPLAVHQSSDERAHFIEGVSLAKRIAQIPKQYLVGYDAPAEIALTVLAGLLALAAAWLLVRRAAPPVRGALWPAFAIAAVAILAPVLVGIAGADYVVTRNLIAALPLCLVLAGAGFAAWPRAGVVAAGALCALWLTVVIAVDVTPAYQRDDWRAAARAIGPPGPARAIVVAPGNGLEPLELYAHARPYPSSGAEVRELVSVAVATRGANSQEGRTAAPPPHVVPTPGFRVIEQRRTGAYSLVRLRATQPRGLTAADVLFRSFGSTTRVALLQAGPGPR